MNVGQVEFAILADGADGVLAQVREVERVVNGLDGRKAKVTLDSNIRDFQKALTGLQQKKIQYKADFSNAMNQAKAYSNIIDNLATKATNYAKSVGKISGRVRRTDFGPGRFPKLTEYLSELQGTTKQIEGQQSILFNKAGKQLAGYNKQYTAVHRKLARTRKLMPLTPTEKEFQRLHTLFKLSDKLWNDFGVRRKGIYEKYNQESYMKTVGDYNRQIEALKYGIKDFQALNKQNEALYRNGLFSHIPKTIQDFGKLQRSIHQMGRNDAIGAISNQMDVLRTKLNSVSLARAKFAQSDEFGSKAKVDYLGSVGKQYSAEYKWLAQNKAELESFNRALEHRQTGIVRFGSRMQTLGMTMQRITSPFLNVFRGLTMGIGYRALGKVMESITGATSRYDTMRNYANVLNELGINADKKFSVGLGKARTAVDNLEQSVLGLPTGLDEMVSAMRRYAGATGDVERATKLAIAANNSYISGQMDNRAKIFTERQLLALAGGAELAATQWDSLRRNAPMAIRSVANEMKMGVQDMITSLKRGEISGQEFLDVFIKVGTEGRISKAAQRMKMTWDAVSQNISNAFNRMGSNVLDTLDDVFTKVTGRDFLQTVLGVDKNGNAVGGGIKDFIDGISESIQNFIRNNPEKIVDFFNSFKSIDWKGIITGYGEVAANFGKLFVGLGKVFGGRNLVHAMTIGNVLGRIITAIGGFVKGLAGPLAMLSLTGGLNLFGGTGFIGRLFSNLGYMGKHSAMAVKGANALSSVGTAMSGVALTWKDVAFRAVNIGGILAIAGAVKIVASAMQDIQSIDISWGKFGKTAGQMAIAVGEFAALAGAMGALTSGTGLFGVVTTAAMGIGTAEILGISAAIATMAKAMNEIANAKVPDTGKINEVLHAMDEIGKGFKSVNPFESLGKIFDSWSKGAQAGAIKKVTDAFDGIKRLSEIKIEEGAKKRALNNFQTINEFADTLAKTFEISEKSTSGKTYRHRGKTTDGSGNEVRSYATLNQQTKNYAEMVSGLSDSFKFMRALVKRMKKLQDDFSTLTADSQTSPLDFSAVKDTVGGIAKALYGFAKPMEGETYSPFTMLKKAAEQLRGADLKGVVQSFKTIPAIMRAMQTVYNEIVNSSMFGQEAPAKLDTLSAFGYESGKLDIKKSPLGQLEDTLTQMFGAIARIRASMPEDAATFTEDTAMISQAISSIRQIILKMQTLSTEGANTAGTIDMSGIDTIGEKISVFITKIGNALNTLNGMGGVSNVALNAGALNAAVSGIKRAISQLSSMNFDQIGLNRIDGLVERIKLAISKLKAIGSQSVTVSISITGQVYDGVSGLINTAASNIKSALDKIKPLYAKTVSVQITGTVSDGGIPGRIRGVAQAIRSAFASIPTSLTKHVSVNVYGSVNKIGDFGSGLSTGGMVTTNGKPLYRGRGGNIFKPKGTDTVPAMLTPGEYVMRRKAVDTFGARFFQGLNHLDLHGALRALSVRAGQSILPKGNTIINNNKTTNNYNNFNVPVTNNSHSESAGINRAGRIIHALQH